MPRAEPARHSGSRAPRAPPCTLVIFGADGDLAHRLLIPALANLEHARMLPRRFAVVGIGRGGQTTAAWRRSFERFLAKAGVTDRRSWKWLSARMHRLRGDFEDDALYAGLEESLKRLARQHPSGGNALFYLATPPAFFCPIIEKLAAHGLLAERRGSWRRVIIEKPFGHDRASAHALNARLRKVLDESQIYRIDHYLGKETVQNILAFRFANGLVETVWNRDRIDHVQVTAAETVGVEHRGRFYDRTGGLRDMVPNHLFQLVALIAMEPPASFNAHALRVKMAEALAAIRPIAPSQAVRGQYGGGPRTRPYRREPGVARNSSTETYAALRLELDTWRWAGVPFYLRTGKRLARRRTEIAICFKPAPMSPFRGSGVGLPGVDNWLVLAIEPDEGIALQLDAKRPGTRMELTPVQMEFRYRDWFARAPSRGYETLIYDCMVGDPTLFQRADMIECGWRAVQPLLDAWSRRRATGFPDYAAGSDGPAAANELIERGGHAWRPLTATAVPPPRKARLARRRARR